MALALINIERKTLTYGKIAKIFVPRMVDPVSV